MKAGKVQLSPDAEYALGPVGPASTLWVPCKKRPAEPHAQAYDPLNRNRPEPVLHVALGGIINDTINQS